MHRVLPVLLASLLALPACGPCKPCRDQLVACLDSCEADHSGCASDCQTTTNVAGCEDTCDAERDACDSDCDVSVGECEAREC